MFKGAFSFICKVEFSKMRNPCTTCFWMRYLGSMVVITSKALADNCFRCWSLVPEIGAISSGGRDFDEIQACSLYSDEFDLCGWKNQKMSFHTGPASQTGMVLASSSHFRQSISSGSTSLSWLSFYPFNRSHAVVVAVTVNISSYCYWFHCKVLSRRVCHPYYIAPLV
ncbi:hypothetical protein Ahy_B06g079895 isoform D [Arachis hypogaea]|uniref:Uncharacterized protein n=1 Tax=Arachis hypogaea TaxID=3818 RepID=A0A444YGL3_ARAHY|nr:hypothetical protein Ahy_B06g079895 isoform D [Arachis hypogaea]